jgi:hypothetical protein
MLDSPMKAGIFEMQRRGKMTDSHHSQNAHILSSDAYYQFACQEASGLVRWLRPAYQNPGGAQGQQGALAVGEARVGKHGKSGKKMGKLAWPKTMAERVMAVSGALAGAKEAVTAADVAGGFSRAKAADVGEILETLCAMGRAHKGKVAGTFLP